LQRKRRAGGQSRSIGPIATRLIVWQQPCAQCIIANMPRYVIERNIPGAGSLSAEELQAISQKSCGVLRSMGPQIQWVHSYVTADKIYCVYIAADQQTVREHAGRGGFPADRISEVTSVIDPTTAETQVARAAGN